LQELLKNRADSLVPHLFAAAPQALTSNHELDDDDLDEVSSSSTG